MSNTIGIQGSVGNTFSDPGLYYDKRFLARVKPNLYLKACGEMRPLPKSSGTQVKWHRLDKLTAISSALTESTNPSATEVGTAEVTAIPLTYGAFVKVSSELNLKSINPIVEEIQDELADQAALSYDLITFNAIHGNLTNQFAGGVSTEVEVADASLMSPAELRKAVYTLRKASVPGAEGNLYKGVFHVAQQFDLLSDTATGSFIDLKKYTDPKDLMNGEVGQMFGVRMVFTPSLPTGTGATDDTFRGFVFGKQAFGVVELAGHGVKTYRFNQGSTENPLEMYSTIGWKMITTAKVLNSIRGVEIYTGSTAE